MKNLVPVATIFLTICFSTSSFAGISQITHKINKTGKYEGQIVSITNCKLGPGDRRSCNSLTLKLKSGSLVKADFFLGGTLLKDGKNISIVDENKSKWEQDSMFAEMVKKELKKGTKAGISVSCEGDEGCLIQSINLIKE